MGVSNFDRRVLVDENGATLADFKPANASNIKIQDLTFYTITSNPQGSNANGAIVLTKASGSTLNMDGGVTIYCTGAYIDYPHSGGDSVPNMYLSLKGAKILFTNDAKMAELVAPMVGDWQTQIIYRRHGTLWNSKHPGTNLDGSTIMLHHTGDGHLSKHPLATVRNVRIVWKSIADNNFVLGMGQNWDDTNKPSVLEGFNLVSIMGNSFIRLFTFNTVKLASGMPNNAFLVLKDLIYDVAKPGKKPTSISRSHRRSSFKADVTSYWGANIITPTYLFIDAKTTLSDTGVLDSEPTYFNTINYANYETTAYDDTSDILAFSFKPTIKDSNSTLSDVNISVINNSPLTLDKNEGVFRAKLVCAGYTGVNGRFVIVEPLTKDYSNNNSRRTDSITIKNKALTWANHKWWEKETKLIIIADSRGSVGLDNGDSYKDDTFTFNYRKSGYLFVSQTLKLDKPYTPEITLSRDACYTLGDCNTSDFDVTYLNNCTTVILPNRVVTLDEIYKSIVDIHANAVCTDQQTKIPLIQNTAGVLTINNDSLLTFVVPLNCKINNGELLRKLETRTILSNDFRRAMQAPFVDGEIVGYVEAIGTEGNDIELREVTNHTVLGNRAGDGRIIIKNDDLGKHAYIARIVNGIVVASSINEPFILSAGDNGTIELYAGRQIQVADVTIIKRDLEIINRGVKKASLLIPHNEDV